MATKRKPLPKTRFLTIGYQYYESRHKDVEFRYQPRQVPVLRLSGDWLQLAGLGVGRKVRVKLTRCGLAIKAEK